MRGKWRVKLLLCNRYRVSVWEEEKVLENSGDNCIVMRMYLLSLYCIFKNG